MNGLTNLRHLSVKVDRSKHDTEVLPALTNLQSLDVFFSGRNRPPSYASAPKLVDFRRFPNLASLYVEGDMWSGLVDNFTGSTETLSVCVLRGPLVINSMLDQFFGLMMTCLRVLSCYGSHLIGPLNTRFEQLQHLSLHKVICGRSFPFDQCPSLLSLALEAEDVDGASRVDNLNTLLQMALLHTASTLRFLTLRSGLFWLLSPIAIHALQRVTGLQGLLLDGAVAMDGRDWMLVALSTKLQLVANVESWMQVAVSRFLHLRVLKR